MELRHLLPLKEFITKKRDAITMSLGSFFVSSWTLFRFYTKYINFDQTGQQLLSRHWLEGYHTGSVMAPTNYILKIIFLYMPAEALGINPKIFLLTSTLAINIMSFICIFLLIKRILRYFNIPELNFLNLLILWIATISGSIYWIQFTNSRNLEVVAGLMIIYLSLLLLKKYSIKLITLLVALSTLTFFADPMQIYTSGLSVFIYILVNKYTLRDQNKTKSISVLLALFIGLIASLVLSYLAKYLGNIEFFSVTSLKQSLTIFSSPAIVIIETSKNLARLFSGSADLGVYLQIANLSFVALGISIAIKIIFTKKIVNHSFISLAIIIVTTPIIIYILSGQPTFRIDTSRYLIMTFPGLIMIFSVLEIYIHHKKIIYTFLSVIILLNGSFVLIATIKNYSKNLPGEIVLKNRQIFLDNYGYDYGYASMDTAIPSMFLYGRNNKTLLPLSCNGQELKKSTLFYDKDVFTKNVSKSQKMVPIILDGNTVNNYPYLCTLESIFKQLGKPIAIKETINGDAVLIYPLENTLRLAY